MKHNLFMAGGSKGVGKTTLTLDIANILGLDRIETGKIVLDYVAKNLPLGELTAYLTREILYREGDLIFDTHYARYSDQEEPNKQFRRGLETEDLARLAERFNIFPCLIEVPAEELGQRRRRDSKRRVLSARFIEEEIEFNRRGYNLYLEELGREPFILINNFYADTRSRLIEWIVQNRK